VSVYPVTNSSALVTDVPPGQSYILSFAVSWRAPDGSSPTASSPLTLTIVDPGIHAGDTVYEVTSTGLTAVGVATIDGRATISFSNDPIFAVAAVPKLKVEATATRRGVVIEVSITCEDGAACRGSGTLTVARIKSVTGAITYTHLAVATAKLSLRAGERKTVSFAVVTNGTPRFSARAPITHFRTTMVLQITGATRIVRPVAIRD
jgi:hypothetical protein